MKTILVSTDFSVTGNNAVKFAVHYAKVIKSRLVIFHSTHLPPFKPTISRETKDLVKQVKFKKIKVIVQKEKQGLTILEQIVRYLKNHKSEVLVMFPEVRSLFDKLFVRSKTEEFVYDTKLPLPTFLKSNVTQ